MVCGQDYLTAPMPFLIGLQASLLPSLKRLPMDEVTLVDLDLGTCEPSPGSPRDDARLLPWSDRLQAALQVTSLHYMRFAHATVQAMDRSCHRAAQKGIGFS